MSATVWVVVLNWNGRDDTVELLHGLVDCEAEILLVDNASTDGTVSEVRRLFPAVRILETGANLGYAGGNNRGVELALASGADIICVLNNDTIVDREFLAPLVDAVSREPQLAVSPDIRYADHPDRSWFEGGVVDRRTGTPIHASVEATQYLSGCCVLAPADVWRKVGLFDEGFFLIFEDNDWSWRARAAGVRLRVVRESTIRHKVSRSFVGPGVVLGAYYFSRNGAVFAARHLGAGQTLRFAWVSVIRVAVHDLVSGHRPRAVARLSGLCAALFGVRGPAGRLMRRLAYRSAG